MTFYAQFNVLTQAYNLLLGETSVYDKHPPVPGISRRLIHLQLNIVQHKQNILALNCEYFLTNHGISEVWMGEGVWYSLINKN